MDDNNSRQGTTFFERLGLAFKLLFNGGFGAEVKAGLEALEASKAPPPAPPIPPPERVHASGLFLLGALQREGRLIDFLQQDVASFSDEEVGAAARVVHGGCKKVLGQYFDFQPAAKESEGAPMAVPAGFDAQRIRLTGNVAGKPPFRGTLKHHGWVATGIRLPAPSETMDPRVIAPAEVELP
jgi:hypothetical protein